MRTLMTLGLGLLLAAPAFATETPAGGNKAPVVSKTKHSKRIADDTKGGGDAKPADTAKPAKSTKKSKKSKKAEEKPAAPETGK